MSRAWSVRRAFLSMLWHSFRRGGQFGPLSTTMLGARMSRFSKRTGGAIIAAVFLMVGATSASAVTQLTTPASCSTEVRVPPTRTAIPTTEQ